MIASLLIKIVELINNASKKSSCTLPAKNVFLYSPAITKIKSRFNNESLGCLESVEWNGGMDYWNGILEWTGTRSLRLHVI